MKILRSIGILGNKLMARKSSAIATIVVVSLVVAYIDYLVPQEVPVDILYAIPIWLAVWAFDAVGVLLVCTTALGLFSYSNYILGLDQSPNSPNFWAALLLTGILFYGLGLGSYLFKLNQASLQKAHVALKQQVANLDMLYHSSQTLAEQSPRDAAKVIEQLADRIMEVTEAKQLLLELNDSSDLDHLLNQFQLDSAKLVISKAQSHMQATPTPTTTMTQLAFPLNIQGGNFGTLLLLGVTDPAKLSHDPTTTNLHYELVQALVRHLVIALQNYHLHQQSLQLAVTDERNRLAREIHDVLAQGLTGIIFQVQAARISSGDIAAVTQRLDQIEKLARDNLQEARRSVANLRPLPLEGNSLSEALQQLLYSFERGNDIATKFKLSGEVHPLAGDVESALYRITQEALSNIARHSAASSTDISLDFDEDEVCLTITDNGHGFNSAKNSLVGFISTNDTQRKYGLATMQERARLIGGLLTIEGNTESKIEVSLAVGVLEPASSDLASPVPLKKSGSRIRIIVPYEKI
jgi:signal transduction histidine kinase